MGEGRRLGIPAMHAIQLARGKEIPSHREGMTWTFPRQKMQRWITGPKKHYSDTINRTSGDGSASFSVVESNDLDHYQAQPDNWNVKVHQLSKGTFRSPIRGIQAPGIVAYDNQCGCASMIQGESPEGWIMLGGGVATDRAGIRWCGQSIGPTRAEAG